MLERTTRFIDKLPLAGKYALGSALKGYTKSSPEKEFRKYLGVNALLGVYVVGHAMQAKLGTDIFTEHLHQFTSTGNTHDAALSSLDATYVAVNGAVTLRQMALMKKAHDIRKWRSSRRELLQSHHDSKAERSLSGGQTVESHGSTKKVVAKAALAFTVTIGGQAAMLASMNNGLGESYHAACVVRADRAINDAVERNQLSHDALEDYRQEWVQFCHVNQEEITEIPSND